VYSESRFQAQSCQSSILVYCDSMKMSPYGPVGRVPHAAPRLTLYYQLDRQYLSGVIVEAKAIR